MSNEIRSKLMPLGIAAILSVGLAACDSNVAVDRAGGAQGHRDKWLQWHAARPQVLRAKLDAARGRVWVLHVDGVDAYDATSNEKVGSTRLPGWSWASEPYVCSPDLAVGPGGAVLVTSNVFPAIWRIDPASFEVTRHDVEVESHRGRDIGFSGLAYSARQSAFFAVSGLDSSLWRIDPSLMRAQLVGLTASLQRACGVAVIPRGAQNTSSDALCVQTELGNWRVNLAPDHRSGYAEPALCAVDSTISRAPMQNAARSQR